LNRSPRALALLALWLATLAMLGWIVERRLTLGTDLRLFLPSPTTPEQRLLLEEIGEGPAARVLAIALAGTSPERLADSSRALVASLQQSERFRFVTNGELSLDGLPESLSPYRYLLSSTLDAQPLDAERLRKEVEARARDLSSPAGAFLEEWVARDPTLELLKTLEAWQPTQEPRREFDVWFDRRGERALLLAETQAPAFDPEQQRLAIDEIRRALATIDSERELRITISGSGQFSVLMEERTRSDAQRLGALATLGMAVLVLIAYRRPSAIVLSALPLATAALAGLAAVSAAFDAVHGITLAFGFTLIGVAQDYPIHLLSHRRDDHDAYRVARSLWPALATGVASTCIAYLTFLFSGVVGLEQLACFTVAGLAAAGLTTRFLLPALLAQRAPDAAQARFVAHTERVFQHAPRPAPLIAVLIAVCAALLVSADQPFWESDLSKLTPVPQALLAQDQELRMQLGAADVRYLLIVRGKDQQRALALLESLDPELRRLVTEGAIAGYDHAARYLPSFGVQRSRQARLPDERTLRNALREAVASSPFRPDAFEPFVMDVAAARTAPPLTLEQLRNTPLGPTLEALLRERDDETLALVTFSGVSDANALGTLAADMQGAATLLDLKEASESLVAAQRERILWSLAAGAVLLVIVIAAALRDPRRVVRVLAPMTLTTLVVLAVLQGAGVSLTLFHLIALILAAGLGLDYALFFEHSADDAAEQRRTLHAILICAASTLMVFVLLATSSLPVLQAIGVTVSIGVASNFALAWVITRRGSRLEARGASQRDQNHSGSSLESQASSLPSPASLIPHQGSMCLLDRVIAWTDERIELATSTHRAPANPLRENGRLRAVHLCEYGAQAMAVHGALRSRGSPQRAAPGMLVSLRAVSFSRDYVEDLPGALRVEAHCLQASESSLQYSFRVIHAEEVLAEGRAAVVLSKEIDEG
jgi:predicted exporter/predicted hotdog family 3-hydroxylacyl-ACP dehydratase